ncbi:MAG: hypothetical protein Q8N02_03320 [Methylotenera sp.]|nr:hypothetical protein [Methylotenera sp.]MDO9231943.1 hypothetical protein [Methylotenera sp.]MDO9388504.1 hypothetical protein [Methylotenera sp.]MDP2102357.1 hypothetical protein [Methylotenera sp.]MDP2280997.1 hypothetical protein [Methylotenera sp.]
MRISSTLLSILLLSVLHPAQAEILPEAQLGIKITLANKATTRPMTVAHIPSFKRYYIADGGLAPMGSELEAAVSKSLIHAYDEDGNYINSSRPGYDNRSIYYNPNTYKLETITYNVSSDVGFAPNTGIFSIDLAENGDLKDSSLEILGFNPAFGDSDTMPSYNAETNQYYAKQKRSNKVWVVDTKLREKVSEILLDFTAAGVAHDDVTDSFVAFSGVKDQELVLLDIDHKSVLIFDLNGKYIGKSELPKNLKLRANNHYNGTGYANDLLFVFHEPEGEFGTYYGFKVLKNN